MRVNLCPITVGSSILAITYSSNAELLAKGQAKLVSPEDLEKFEQSKSTFSREFKLPNLFPNFPFPIFYIPSMNRSNK